MVNIVLFICAHSGAHTQTAYKGVSCALFACCVLCHLRFSKLFSTRTYNIICNPSQSFGSHPVRGKHKWYPTERETGQLGAFFAL